MLRVALKDILSRKRRLVTTGLAIILGIAFLTGTQVLSTVLKESIESVVGEQYKGFDAVVRSPEVQEIGFGQNIRSPLPEDVLDQVTAVDGVAVAEGVVEMPTIQLIGTDNKIVGGNFGPPTITYAWLDDPALRYGTLIDGVRPEGDGQIAMDFAAAESAGYGIGDTVSVTGPAGRQEFELVGIVGLGDGTGSSGGARFLIFDTPTAQELAQMPGEFNYFAVVADDGVSQQELADSLVEALPGQQVLTGDVFVAESQDSIAGFVDILGTFVSVFGYVAVFVAAFIIYNTFSILIAQRTRETALLRAIGAKRKQILAATVIEAMIIGFIASVLGLALGLLLGFAGAGLISDSGSPSLPNSAIVSAFVIGIGVTVLSGLIPAWRSTKVPPIAALSEVAIDRSDLSRARIIWGTAFLAVGLGLVGTGFTGKGTGALVLFGVGAVLVLVSVAVVLGPLLAAPFARLVSWPFARAGSITWRLAGENSARNPRRTASTAAALTIGVTLVTLIAVLASSIKTSVDSAVSSSTDAQFVISTSSFQPGNGIPITLADQIREVPGVTLTSPVRFAPFRLTDAYALSNLGAAGPDEFQSQGAADAAPPGEDDFMLGIDPVTFFEVFDLGVTNGTPTEMAGDQITALAKVAEDRGWEIGDTIPLYFAQTGTKDFTLVGTFETDAGLGNYLVPLDSFETNVLPFFNVDFIDYIQTSDDADMAAVRSDLEALVADSPALVVQDLQEYTAAQTAPFDLFLNIVYALLGLAVIIALIGIANTLSLSVLERTKELGLLRAVGMKRKQVRRTVVFESVIIAVFGTVIGLVIGIAMSFTLTKVIAADNPDLVKFSLPVSTLVAITVIAALAGVLAAVLPAWRASRLDVLKAISSV